MLNAKAHFAAKHPPEKGDGWNEKLVDFGSPWIKRYNGIASKYK
jgi:hypothetical protein